MSKALTMCSRMLGDVMVLASDYWS